MTRAGLISILMNTELEDHPSLTREQARAIVNEIFAAIAEALRDGEVVRLPLGNFGVYEQERQPLRRWFLGRVRVTYKQRYVIKFIGDVYDLEPADQPPHALASKGEMNPSQNNAPPKISPKERRKLVAIGIKAGKSRRLIAHELNVTETTIRRDMKALGIAPNKKPTATRRKPAVVWKVAPQHPAKPHQPAPRNVVPRPVTLKPKPPSPETPLSPEELRRQHLEEMLQLVQAWFVERDPDYTRATTVVDKARNSLAASRPDFYARGLPESPMSAAQLRDHTRPKEMDSAKSQGMSRREHVCALWLARWLAAWEPQDKKLRNNVLNQVRTNLSA
jgi:nucleoid DNA-binding protein